MNIRSKGTKFFSNNFTLFDYSMTFTFVTKDPQGLVFRFIMTILFFPLFSSFPSLSTGVVSIFLYTLKWNVFMFVTPLFLLLIRVRTGWTVSFTWKYSNRVSSSSLMIYVETLNNIHDFSFFSFVKCNKRYTKIHTTIQEWCEGKNLDILVWWEEVQRWTKWRIFGRFDLGGPRLMKSVRKWHT